MSQASPLAMRLCSCCQRRAMGLEAGRSPSCRRCDRWLGRISSDSTSEKTSVGMTISGTTRMILPMLPGTASSGAKAAIEVVTAKITGLWTSKAPRTAAPRPSSPPW